MPFDNVSEQQRYVRRTAASLLAKWSHFAERDWYDVPGAVGLGCYGTGYNGCGVQTNQKYVAAMAALATCRDERVVDAATREQALRRALSALRFSMGSHRSGSFCCTDGSAWGHTWISPLGIERMMCGVQSLSDALSEADIAALATVLTSEAEWLIKHYEMNGRKGVRAGLWNCSGDNVPESNLWIGAMLWRTAERYSRHPDNAIWRAKAHAFLINAVSVPDDVQNDRELAGRPISAWFRGANFFPNYALDHHGYLNVGYMAICVSQAAILYFDMIKAGGNVPEPLFHHQGDLWRVLRRFVFSNGRLARIGGDSRLRYAYCQEYLMPSLLFAAHCLGDEYALGLLCGQLSWIETEAEANNDGSFYGKRFARLAEQNPYYYTRLESDRACALAMILCYLDVLPEGGVDKVENATDKDAFELSVAGGWSDVEHGCVAHRSARRMASFAWRAHGLAQGLCLPPDCGHMAEWLQNLGGRIRFLGDHGVIAGTQTCTRRLLSYHIREYDGGFVTCGKVEEGVGLVIQEGWSGDAGVVHQLAFAALPDERTVIGLQYAVNPVRRSIVAELTGILLNLPNDLFNGFSRKVATARGEMELKAPARTAKTFSLRSPWVNIDERLGLVIHYGADELSLRRTPARHGGRYPSLLIEQIGAPMLTGMVSYAPGDVLLDVGWSVLSDSSADETALYAGVHALSGWLACVAPGIRGVEVAGADGVSYAVLMNIAGSDISFHRGAIDLARPISPLGGEDVKQAEKLTLASGHAQVYTLGNM